MKTKELRAKVSSRLSSFNSRRLISSSALGLGLFSLGYWLIYPILLNRGDFARLGGVIVSVVLLGLATLLLIEFVAKQSRLDGNTQNLSITTAINTLVGFSFPLLVITLVTGSMMKLLGSIANYDTIWCELRRNLVSFYYHNHIYYHMFNLFLLSILLAVVLLVLGNAWEKSRR